MKKIISLFLLICILTAVLVPAAASAASTESYLDTTGTFWYRINDDDTAEIVGYQGDSRILSIPIAVDGHTVTVLGMNAFYKQWDPVTCDSMSVHNGFKL